MTEANRSGGPTRLSQPSKPVAAAGGGLETVDGVKPHNLLAKRSRRKREVRRPYPPDYVSAETLAYRLDCSDSKIYDDVRKGLLPKPIGVGTLQRWRWSDVEEAIAAQNALATPDHDSDLQGRMRA